MEEQENKELRIKQLRKGRNHRYYETHKAELVTKYAPRHATMLICEYCGKETTYHNKSRHQRSLICLRSREKPQHE